jgi:hypothetical protein
VFGSGAYLIMILGVLLLPETRGRDLPETRFEYGLKS